MREEEKRGWEHFPHRADMGVRGYGETMAAAFEEAAVAMTGVITDTAKVGQREKVEIKCSAADRELLLVDWLNALLYEMDIRRMLFSRFEVSIEGNELKGTAWGEKTQVEKHEPAVEVKGATYTELSVREEGGRWMAQCVVDV